jgi:hypothetical protein
MRRNKARSGIGLLAAAALLAGSARAGSALAPQLAPAYLDELLAPVALYPDQLLAQILLCAGNPTKVVELADWLKRNSQLKGSELQQAAEGKGFEPSFIALAPFPQVVNLMAGNRQWTSQLGGAFQVDKGAVFDSIQRLRAQSRAAGNLKSTPQQKVETRTTQGGEQVIVIEPANPQVVYVPQYNPQVVYTQPASTSSTTVVVVEDDDDDEEAVVGAMIGFTAGVAMGAAWNNHYYYGPYGWHGGAYMYNDGWNDWYDDRADAREDWYENREDAREDYADHRENMADERSERAENAREQRGERSSEAREQRSERAGTAQEQRTARQESRTSGETQAQREQRRTEAQGKAQQARSTASSTERSGTRSDAFSNYSSGKSTRDASSRGSSSRSSSSGSRGGRRR